MIKDITIIPEDIKNKFTLRDIPLFAELSVAHLRQITAVSKLKRFAKHDILFNEGDFYTGFYILLKGVIKVYKISSTGKESVVHIVKPFNVQAGEIIVMPPNIPHALKALVKSKMLLTMIK